MPQLPSLGLQIFLIVWITARMQGDTLHHRYPHNEKYLETKAGKLGHMFEGSGQAAPD